MATSSTELTAAIRSCIDDVLPELIETRHDLHQHPELMYEEHRTSGVVQNALQQAGIEHVADLGGGTGVLGHLPGKSDHATGLRADMDALPIHEETGLPHASTVDGKMHACGHDGHTTILIGAARVLARLAADHELPHPVSFLFQPAEEGGGGGKKMVDDGCLDGRVIGPTINRMFGLHGWPALPEGVVGSRPGPLLAATDSFEIEVRGIGGHAAMPHHTVDPIAASAMIINSLQQAVSRQVDPVMGGVISVTMIQAGAAFNVIPESCSMRGTVRALYPEAQEILRNAVKSMPRDIAKALRCEATVTYHNGYPITRNDEATTAHFHALAKEALGEERVAPLEFPVMGGEDFSYYCEVVPSCFFVLGQCPPDQESMPGLHHPAFDFNDRTIATGVEMFCRLAMS